ncbi:MAG: hypothetical protein WKF84_28825 [Pyrinomonadaceae bacterium]
MAKEDSQTNGVEIVTVGDSAGRGVYVSCNADVAPADLVAGLCDLIAQVTKAALADPRADRAGDLELGRFEVTEDDEEDDLVS